MIRIGIVDDHPVITDGLMASLATVADLEVAWTANSLQGARDALAGGPTMDVVLVDVRLSDGSGLDLLPGEGQGPPAFLVLSQWDRPQYASEAFVRGAVGYLLKDAPLLDIVAAVRAAAAGGLAYGAHQLAPLRDRRGLTAREAQIVRLVARGRSNGEISRDLSISKKTVEAYLTRLYERGGHATRTELALWAEREGWLDTE